MSTCNTLLDKENIFSLLIKKPSMHGHRRWTRVLFAIVKIQLLKLKTTKVLKQLIKN